MPRRQLALGVLVTMIWGLNFSVIKLGEETFSPLMLGALRFALSAIPAIFFFKRPPIQFRYVALYGLVFGVLQFGLLFIGIAAGLSAGLSSVVLQLQVFFTIALGVLFANDHFAPRRLIGAILAFSGVTLIGFSREGSATVVGLLLVVAAAFSWGMANIIVKKVGVTDMVSFVAWASLVPPIPMFLLSLGFDGWDSIEHSFTHVTWVAVGSVAYLVYPTTLFAFAVWNGLLRKYPTSTVAPLTLLVPVFGFLGSMLIFDEVLTPLKAVAIGLMITGLFIHLVGIPRRRGSTPTAQPAAQPGAEIEVADDDVEPASSTRGHRPR